MPRIIGCFCGAAIGTRPGCRAMGGDVVGFKWSCRGPQGEGKMFRMV